MNFQNSSCLDLSNDLENVPVYLAGDICEVERPAFQYSPDNVQGPGCSIDPSEVALPGCSCVAQTCLPESCSCLRTYGQAYDSSGALLERVDTSHCMPVFECSALCPCSDACSNRVVQRGLRLRLEVCRTADRGWGVRASEPIPRGAFVCEYAGEVVGFEEARRRQLSQGPGDNNYIIAVREHAGRGSVTETFVDPAAVGNVGRFLNHACAPNLFMLPVRVHSTVPRLALFAGRDISAQEELTFDYAGGCNNIPSVEQSEAVIEACRKETVQRKACRCGAQNCARFLPLDRSVLRL